MIRRIIFGGIIILGAVYAAAALVRLVMFL